jgi:tetratricopeptide (TPR) repeat protein
MQAGLAAADDACGRGDLDAALRVWTDLRKRHPDVLATYLHPARALRQTGRDAEAEALLTDAVRLFPGELEPIVIYAFIAQIRGDKNEAVRRLSMLLDRFPAHQDSYKRIILLLRDLGRFGEAEERAVAAMDRFPTEPWFAAQYGWTALARQALDAAAQRFQICRERFPDDTDAILGAAQTLRRGGYMQQADDLLASGVDGFPADSRLAFGYADHGLWMRNAGLLSWDRAIARWETLRKTFPTYHPGYLEGIRVLVDAGRHAEAEALAADAVAVFPSDASLAAAFANRAEDRQDWPESVRRFQRIVELWPDQSVAHAGLGRALSLSGRYDEAENILAAALERFPRDPGLAIEYAMTANRRSDWSAAVTRWSAAQRHFPEHLGIAHSLGEARLRLVDLDDTIAHEPEDVPGLAAGAIMPGASVGSDGTLDRDAMRQVVMQFESLGGDTERGGCEFGLFQRDWGAEPLGLLRWSTMRHHEIIAVLEADFEAVGSPENTELYLGAPKQNPEYFTLDKRFGMRMHTFVRAADVPFDTMYKQVCRRLQFLTRKLLTDLRSANKIFVYSCYPNDLDDAQIDRLFAAIRRYGNTTLLYVRSADEAHADGSVIERAPGLMIGHIESRSKSGRDFVGGSSSPSWAKICPKALDLWNAHLDASAVK